MVVSTWYVSSISSTFSSMAADQRAGSCILLYGLQTKQSYGCFDIPRNISGLSDQVAGGLMQVRKKIRV